MRQHLLPVAAIAALLSAVTGVNAACCYFSAKNADILQPAQKVFITWDPKEQVESFTVQPKFEGNARDFGMVIPTPSKPKLDEMPRDFFKELAVFSILKKREQPQSKLFPPEIYLKSRALGLDDLVIERADQARLQDHDRRPSGRLLVHLRTFPGSFRFFPT